MNQPTRTVQIPQRYLTIAIIVALVIGVFLVYRLLTAGLQAYLALITGVMLLIGNAPELVRSIQRREIGLAMLNTLVGLGLIAYFVGTITIAPLFWPLSIVFLLLALPLTINRAGIAGAYLTGLRQLISQARVLLRFRSRSV